MMAQGRHVRFLMFRQYYELPILSWLFRAMGCIPVSSDDGPKELVRSLQRAKECIRSGEAVCIFAEGGTRPCHGQMQKFKKGFERMVDGVAAPIVPVHLDHVETEFLRGQGPFQAAAASRNPVTVSFGKSP